MIEKHDRIEKTSFKKTAMKIKTSLLLGFHPKSEETSENQQAE